MEACGGGGDGRDMGFQQEVCNPVISCDPISMAQEASVVMAMSSMPVIPKLSSAHHDPFFGPGWDPISSMTQNHQNFGCAPMVPHRNFANFHFPPPIPLWESQGINPQLAHYPPPGSSFDEMVPRAPCFMSRGLPDMVGPMGLPQCGPIANPGPSYTANVDGSAMQGMQNTEGETMASPSSERRRKRTPESSSPYESNKNNEEDLLKDPSGDASDVQKEQNEKKQKTEQTESGNSRGKQTKDDSNSQEPPKENYIHVRARRGQATNSHSLAERVRREKISERMKMLQELVPGCNKITGKAVMLDEIINYVQSLQQQVEFLSMKLATLLPDLSVDLERVLSKEILQAHGRDALARGLGPGRSLPLPYNNTLGILPGALPTTSQYPPLPQAPLSNDFQALFQMGFDSNSAIDMLKQNGRLKPEQ